MAKGDMTAKEYYDKHGYNSHQEPDWSNLNNTDRDIIKDQRPFFEGPGEQEQQMAGDIWEDIQAGPDTNIWRGLSEMLGIPAGAIKKFATGKFGELMRKPDFGKEYGLKAEELERQWAGAASSRGLLDSSSSAAALGGGLSNLMLERARMEEGAMQNRTQLAGGFLQQGIGVADQLNAQYLQNMGLQAEALNYLANLRGQKNQFNLQRYAINPNLNDPTTFTGDILPGLMEIGASFIPGGGGFDFGGWLDQGGGGGNNNINTRIEPDLYDPYTFDQGF